MQRDYEGQRIIDAYRRVMTAATLQIGPFRCPILASLQSFDRRHWLRSIRADRGTMSES